MFAVEVGCCILGEKEFFRPLILPLLANQFPRFACLFHLHVFTYVKLISLFFVSSEGEGIEIKYSELLNSRLPKKKALTFLTIVP